MTVLTDSRYAGLAGQAASALGSSSPDVVRAILSQWQCELGANAPWPPPRNNPGNIARGLASELGLAYTVAPGPNPQPGNPIVAYPSASVGAQAYAAAIATHSRYAGALRAARAGDGLAFLRAIGSSGWGTGLSCMLGVYRGSGATGSGGTTGSSSPSPSSGTYLTIKKIFGTRLASSCTQYTVLYPGSAVAEGMGAFPIPKENIGDACIKCADGWVPAVVTQADYGLFGIWTDPSTLPPNTPNACVKSTMKEGQRIGPLGLPGYAADSVAGAIPGLLVNGGVLAVAAYLVLTGLRDALEGS